MSAIVPINFPTIDTKELVLVMVWIFTNGQMQVTITWDSNREGALLYDDIPESMLEYIFRWLAYNGFVAKKPIKLPIQKPEILSFFKNGKHGNQ